MPYDRILWYSTSIKLAICLFGKSSFKMLYLKADLANDVIITPSDQLPPDAGLLAAPVVSGHPQPALVVEVAGKAVHNAILGILRVNFDTRCPGIWSPMYI